MRYVNGALQPDNFMELADVNALARPGPLHNGAANEYIDIKMGRKQPEVMHPALAHITANTKYQIVYQEQILRILGEIGGFDWTHRAEVRRIISRKIGEQAFNRKWEQFRDGAARLHDMPEEEARNIWGKCITAGSYAFNASHAVAYSLLGYYDMWFKRHQPSLFFAEKLKVTGDDDKKRSLVRDTQRHGRHLTVAAPHPGSGGTWRRSNNGIEAGFCEIPGVGPAVASSIIAYREENELSTWDDLINVKGIGVKTLSTMKDFVEQEDPFGAFWLDRAIKHVKYEIRRNRLRIPNPTHVATDLPYSTGEDVEITWLGVLRSRNVRDLFEFNQAKGAEVDFEKKTLNGKPIKDPHLREWCVMVGDDETDQIGLRCDRWHYPKWRDLIWKIRLDKDLVLVRGYKPGWMPTRQITIVDLWVIDPEL
jgi:hypothetical protein